MQIKASFRASLLQVLLGGLFLCNPVWGFSDFLPDLFGYLLIWNGLSRLADLSDSIFESRVAFRNLIWVGLGEIAVRYFLRDAAARQTSEYQQPTWILLFSFAVLVLHFWLLIPAFKQLFAGFERLMDKYPSAVPTDTSKNKVTSARISRLSVIFVAAHAILSVLPELAILTSYEYHEDNALFGFDWYAYINLFRTVGVVIAAIFGLVWLIAFLRYFVAIVRDREWLERLDAAYAEEILPQAAKLRTRRLSTAFSLLSVGIFFTASLRMDEQVAVSGVFFALTVGLAALYLGELLPSRKICRTPCIVLGVVSIANALVKYLYLSQYSVEASEYYTGAFWFFAATQLLEILEAAATLLLVFVLLRMLTELVALYTGVYYGTEGSEMLSERATAKLHRSFEKRAIAMRIVFSLAAVGYMFEAVLQLTLDSLWLYPFALSLVGIGLFLEFLHQLSTEVTWKYQSDTTYRRD